MEKFLTVAKIVKPQGIRGEVKALALTDSPEDLSRFTTVYIGGNMYKLLSSRPMGAGCACIRLSGVCDRNAAEALRESLILVRREDAPTLPEGRFYIEDIIGCTVRDELGDIIGTVKDITSAKTDVYEVQKPDGTKIYFPAAEGVISEIDVEGGVVTVNFKRLKEVALEEK